MNNVVVLGATGSIGTSTLDVIARHKDSYTLYGATAHSNYFKMAQIIRDFAPVVVVMTEKNACEELRAIVKSEGHKTQVLFGQEALCAVATSEEVDSVMSAIVGSAGLKPTLAAVSQGKTIYLANKESLVMTGRIFVDSARRYKAKLLPVDSEHNAIFQCLPEEEQALIGRCDLPKASISKIILTGSGGPFRELDIAKLKDVTPSQAVAHPNWAMGKKISVDSATMMNKGLEFIEARWLFNAKTDDIEVIIHPQSVIHSMVQYFDGSVLAQLGEPDMRTPIARAMAWPKRITSGVKPLDFTMLSALTFMKPDFARYPCLKLAIEASNVSQAMTTAVNAANEVAVGAFLQGDIAFTDIYTVCARVAEKFVLASDDDLDAILEVDLKARMQAYSEIAVL